MHARIITAGVLAAVLVLAAFATPAAAEPLEDQPAGRRAERRAPSAQQLEQQIERLTKQLKQLQARLHKAQQARGGPEEAPGARPDRRRVRDVDAQQRRVMEARQRLAGLLTRRKAAESGATPPRARRAPDGRPGRPARTERPAGRGRPERGQMDQGSVLRRLVEGHKSLAARVERLEQMVRRLAAAVGRHAGAEKQRGKPKDKRARHMRGGKRGKALAARQGNRHRGKGPWAARAGNMRKLRAMHAMHGRDGHRAGRTGRHGGRGWHRALQARAGMRARAQHARRGPDRDRGRAFFGRFSKKSGRGGAMQARGRNMGPWARFAGTRGARGGRSPLMHRRMQRGPGGPNHPFLFR
jgi:hypothetical protein